MTQVITTIIGIDCAVDAKNTGLVRAHAAGETLIITETLCGSRDRQSADIVANWIRGADRSLLALDAPRVGRHPSETRWRTTTQAHRLRLVPINSFAV